VTHSYTVVHSDGVELGRIASKLLYLSLNNLTDFVQMGMTGHKLGERIDYGNDGLAELLPLHAGSYPKGTGSRHTTSFCANGTPKLIFHYCACYLYSSIHNIGRKDNPFFSNKPQNYAFCLSILRFFVSLSGEND
jgi:hypothetical protein